MMGTLNCFMIIYNSRKGTLLILNYRFQHFKMLCLHLSIVNSKASEGYG
jgi:hypothetical protein